MKSVSQIINHWPTAAELGRQIGVEPLTVRAWRMRGSIPPRYWPAIVRASNGAITTDDLVQTRAETAA